MCLPHISGHVVFSGLESTGMLCRYERAAVALARMRACTGLFESSLLAYSISTKLNSHALACTSKSLHINVVHLPASETSFKRRVAGGPKSVRYFCWLCWSAPINVNVGSIRFNLIQTNPMCFCCFSFFL